MEKVVRPGAWLQARRLRSAAFTRLADPEVRASVLLSDGSIRKRALAEKPVAVCARCGAVKDEEGQWSRPGALAQAGLPQTRLTHGLCQICLAEELGHAGLGESAIAAALVQGRHKPRGQELPRS